MQNALMLSIWRPAMVVLLLLALFTPAAANAQVSGASSSGGSLISPSGETKAQAEAAQKAADSSSSTATPATTAAGTTPGESSNGTLLIGLGIAGVFIFGGIAYVIRRDSVGNSRTATSRPTGPAPVGAGAPKNMLDPEAAAGSGRNTKKQSRQRGRRAKQARRANRKR